MFAGNRGDVLLPRGVAARHLRGGQHAAEMEGGAAPVDTNAHAVAPAGGHCRQGAGYCQGCCRAAERAPTWCDIDHARMQEHLLTVQLFVALLLFHRYYSFRYYYQLLGKKHV